MQSFNMETKIKQCSILFVYPYFYAVDASLSNYIDWICKKSAYLPQYMTRLDSFYDSLKWIHENIETFAHVLGNLKSIKR
jgi:hypothetical protein